METQIRRQKRRVDYVHTCIRVLPYPPTQAYTIRKKLPHEHVADLSWHELWGYRLARWTLKLPV